MRGFRFTKPRTTPGCAPSGILFRNSSATRCAKVAGAKVSIEDSFIEKRPPRLGSRKSMNSKGLRARKESSREANKQYNDETK